jgi:2-polyprenyl-3-methyl-5-hydroxy-6-metoxy-1,4-benzoquinol methylase
VKYDGVDVTAGGGETSHAIVAELVGSGKRVLDVGCSTGYLAQVLVQAGNTVSGVELDPEAAEKARPLLDQLVVGDLDEMDLSERFAPKSFDVVVFADVLEHLKDPVRTLSQAAPLLDEEGFAVLSIPNVAHAAVRLSLLQGRFDYSPVGLLDDTHLRFFTRSALHDLLDQAGFVATDVRRTTAPPFGTEIALDPRDFPDEVVGLVCEDPDSSTYQFVLAAKPARGVDASYRREMSRLAEQLSQVAAALRRVPPRPTVGVCAGTSPLEGIRRAVVVAELRRRLDGFAVRAYNADPSAEVSDLTGEALFPLRGGPALADEVDAVVLAGPRRGRSTPWRSPAGRSTRGSSNAGPASWRSGSPTRRGGRRSSPTSQATKRVLPRWRGGRRPASPRRPAAEGSWIWPRRSTRRTWWSPPTRRSPRWHAGWDAP